MHYIREFALGEDHLKVAQCECDSQRKRLRFVFAFAIMSSLSHLVRDKAGVRRCMPQVMQQRYKPLQRKYIHWV